MNKNHFNVKPVELSELRTYKKSENLLILGNGPSATYVSSVLTRELNCQDIVGFSLGLFSNLDLTYYFHEPLYLVPHNPPTYKNSFEYTYYLILYYLTVKTMQQVHLYSFFKHFIQTSISTHLSFYILS